MATSAPYGDGIVRTDSDRQTYAPDGILPSIDDDPRPLRDSTISHASTLAQSPRRTQDESATSTSSNAHGVDMNFDAKEKEISSSKSSARTPVTSSEEAHDESIADIEKQQQPNKPDQNDSKEGEDKDPNLVTWDGPNDPGNPQNFPTRRKWIMTVALGIMTFSVTFASSVFSTATQATSQLFGVSTEVMVLGTSLFVLGFAFGPIVWGPFSELYGRKTPLFAAFFIFAVFQIPVAVAQNLYTIFICRFFGGFFASAPLAIVGGALNDIFDPIDRGVAVCVFAGATFVGPVLGPILGGFITMGVGWRWTAWLTMIMAAFFGLVAFFVVPETYPPVLLQRRAKKLRFETKNWALHAEADEKEVDFKEIADKYLLKPFKMLALEPILVLITTYMGFIYGILYLFFEVYPISFQEQRGWNLGVGALPFLSILIGVVLGAFTIIAITKTRTKHVMEKVGTLVPEERLIPMIIGGGVFPIGLFWFAWTSSPNITPWPQIIAGVPIGMGILMIFLQGLNYIIDVYKMNANSAIAANSFFRSWLGAGFPMFAMAMFNNLGVPWATSLLGFLAVALFPVPILFFVFGARIRKLSKYSPD